MMPNSSSLQPGAMDTSSSVKIFGFWIYLMSDAIIFALLFATYASMSANYAGGPSGKDLFDLGYAFFETIVLLLSTLTCSFAMLALVKSNGKWVLSWLILTFLLGGAFILLEVHEFGNLIAQGAGSQRSGFLSAFFTLVGTHGLHVSVGLIWLFAMIPQIELYGLSATVRSRLYRFSLFWHFLDLIWVAIFSVVYLMGVL